MLFGRKSKQAPAEKPAKKLTPRSRNGLLSPEVKARLYKNSIFGGTPEAAIANSSSLQSLVQEYPDIEFLTNGESKQIGEYLREMGNKYPEKAKPLYTLSEFFGYQKSIADIVHEQKAAQPAPVAPVPIQQTKQAESPKIPEGFGGSVADVVALYPTATPSEPGELVVGRGVEPGQEHVYSVQPQTQPKPKLESLAQATAEPVTLTPSKYGTDVLPVDEPETVERSDPIKDFIGSIVNFANSNDLKYNESAIRFGEGLEKTLQEAKAVMDMAQASTVRTTFLGLGEKFESLKPSDKGTTKEMRELAYRSYKISANYGDDDARKACERLTGMKYQAFETKPEAKESKSKTETVSTSNGEIHVPVAVKHEEPQVPPKPGKGRPYDPYVDKLNSILYKDVKDIKIGDLHEAIEPASKLENLIVAGKAVPLLELKKISEKALELGKYFAGQAVPQWKEARIALQIAYNFSKSPEIKSAFEHAASMAADSKARGLFSAIKTMPTTPVTKSTEGKKEGEQEQTHVITQGVSEAYEYLLQTGPGLEIKSTEKKETKVDPYFRTISGDATQEELLSILKENPTNSILVSSIRSHRVMQSQEMKAKIAEILKQVLGQEKK